MGKKKTGAEWPPDRLTANRPGCSRNWDSVLWRTVQLDDFCKAFKGIVCSKVGVI